VLVVAALVLGCESAPPAGDDDSSSSSGAAMCGMTNCIDEVLLSLVAQGNVLTGGSYAIGWSLDGVDDDCSFTIAGTSDECGGDPPCALDNDCAADFDFASMPQFVSLAITGAPHLFEITVIRDGDVVLEDGFAPQYEDFHPNGSDCPPVCARSSATLDLP
jgi:hypothetical protein